MTDNTKTLRNYLINIGGLPEDNKKGLNDVYYTIELVRRGKDNPDLSAANYRFKTYYITCLQDYDKVLPEIKFLCVALRFRAYMSVIGKSYKQVTLDTCAELARRIAAHDTKKPQSVFESCSGKQHITDRWIIDLDRDPEATDQDWENYCQHIRGVVRGARPGNNILWEVPTRSGIHLITTKFDRAVLQGALGDSWDPEMIKENHITLLYEDIP